MPTSNCFAVKSGGDGGGGLGGGGDGLGGGLGGGYDGGGGDGELESGGELGGGLELNTLKATWSSKYVILAVSVNSISLEVVKPFLLNSAVISCVEY